MAQNTIQGALSPTDLITSTTVVAKEALDVYIAGGSSTGSEYADDSNEFTIGASDGTAMMAVFTTDAVDAGDIGVLSMTVDRKLRVDGTFSTIGNMDTDDDAIVAGQINQNVNSLMMGLNWVTGDWERIESNSFNALRAVPSNGTIDAGFYANILATTQDERYDALAVSAGNYGFWDAGAAGSKLAPMIMDNDDGLIANDQKPQLVINENHIYDPLAMGWLRQVGTAGVADVNVTALPDPLTIQSPLNTDFKSHDHPDEEVHRIVWQDPPYAGGRKNDEMPAQCKWKEWDVFDSRAIYTTGEIHDGTQDFYGPYEGYYCMDLYEFGEGGLGFDQIPSFDLGCPYDSEVAQGDTVIVLEGRFYENDDQAIDTRHEFGFFLYDGAWMNAYMIDVRQLAGVWNAYRGTAHAAEALIGAVPVCEDGWNYFRLEVYPPNWGATGGAFKRLVINGYETLFANLPYQIVSMRPAQVSVQVGAQHASDATAHSLWDEITVWTYFEEYEE